MRVHESVFDVEGFVPADLRHRNDELNHLSTALDPVTRGSEPTTTFLLGPSGTGKTATARFALRQLREETAADAIYLDGWETRTASRTLHRVLDQLDASADLVDTSPRARLREQLRSVVNDPLAVVVDEADMLDDAEVVRDLVETSGIGLVLIANQEEELFGGFSTRLQSRLQGTRVHLEPYTDEELVSILRPRVEQGLSNGAVDDGVLEEIAAGAAGDARCAILALREAAQRAESHSRSRVTADDVGWATPRAQQLVRQKASERLAEHERILYEIVEEAESIAPGELYEQYESRATAELGDARTERRCRDYLSKLASYNLIEARGATSGRRYEIVDVPDGA